jgi:hypothetical protein
LKAINIISFDVPYPANYGGVIDVFFKIKNLHKSNIDIHLHCFEYGRGEQKELEKYCAKVYYYKRKTGISSQLSSTPYIVKSRESQELKANLLSNNFPILFEGLHTCFLLDDPDLKGRFKIFRESNIEHHYYSHLAEAESNPIKKQYYKTEAKKLERFEKIVEHANLGLVVSLTDLDYFQKKYPKCRIEFLPSFHPGENISIKPGIGDYILYHGNLSVAENSNAAEHLIKSVFKGNEIPLIVAGLNPTERLKQLIDSSKNVTLIENPSDIEMDELISNAQINLLYTEQATGLKLKLLNVLYNGRHCLVNPKMVEGTSLESICIVAKNDKELSKEVKKLFNHPVSANELTQRENTLKKYSNEANLKKLLSFLD